MEGSGILGNPRILGWGERVKHVHAHSPSADPGMNLGRVGDTRESQDTWTRGEGGGIHTHVHSPPADPGMNLGRVGDTRESQDTWMRGGGVTYTCTCT